MNMTSLKIEIRSESEKICGLNIQFLSKLGILEDEIEWFMAFICYFDLINTYVMSLFGYKIIIKHINKDITSNITNKSIFKIKKLISVDN